MGCPLVPLAVKLKARETEGPLGTSTPYAMGELTAVTLVLSIKVATRLVVLIPAILRKAKSRVTFSPGSMMPLGGPALASEISATPAGTTRLPLLSWIVRVALLGAISVAFPTGFVIARRTVRSGLMAVLSITGTEKLLLVWPLR